MIYLDTSALVKKYFQESGTHRVRQILESAGTCGISKIAYAEVCAAFGRKKRETRRDAKAIIAAFQSFEQDWRLLTVIEVSDELFPTVRNLTEKHPLRGVDAIHLASAIWLRKVLRDDVTFVAADRRLLQAAQHERLSIINPEKG